MLLFRFDMKSFLFFDAQYLAWRPKILKCLLLANLHALERWQLLSSLPLSLDLSPSFQLDLILPLEPYSLILKRMLSHILLLKRLMECSDFLKTLLFFFEGLILDFEVSTGHDLVEWLLAEGGSFEVLSESLSVD